VKGFSLRSVTVQLIILFVAVLTLFEIVYLGYRYLDRTKALTSLETIRIADNIAVLASIVEKTPPPERGSPKYPLLYSVLPSPASSTRTASPRRTPGTRPQCSVPYKAPGTSDRPTTGSL